VRVLGVLVIAACGAKAPAESLDNLELQRKPEAAPAATARLVTAPRPAIDVSWSVPEFHEELRWPLSGMNHPTLEPQFPIAQELAVGVGWEQLCARGVHNRVSATQKELLSYLRGWCDAAKHDVDSACSHLTPLLGSVKSGLRPAVRRDLANILVDQGNADKAEHWLTKHNIRDVMILDLLAANYIELGSEADAFAINRRAIDSDDYATLATKCTRLVKRIVIGLDQDVEIPIKTLRDMVVKAKVPDDTCRRLWNKVACWRSSEACSGFYSDENLPMEARLLADAYNKWPSKRLTWLEWWGYLDTARLALPTPGAAELVVTAMEAALQAQGDYCNAGMAASFPTTLETVRRAPDAPALEARIQAIEKACPESPSGFKQMTDGPPPPQVP
jgi:hypothetical protein